MYYFLHSSQIHILTWIVTPPCTSQFQHQDRKQPPLPFKYLNHLSKYKLQKRTNKIIKKNKIYINFFLFVVVPSTMEVDNMVKFITIFENILLLFFGNFGNLGYWNTRVEVGLCRFFFLFFGVLVVVSFSS